MKTIIVAKRFILQSLLKGGDKSMRSFVRYCVFSAITVSILVFLTSCYDRGKLPESTSGGEHMNVLDNIVIGESTFHDFMQYYDVDNMVVTSYGGICELELEHGVILRIKFYGKDLVVGSIELKSKDYNDN